MNGPREFLKEMIEPSRKDWQKDPLSERKIRTVTIFLDSMADWMFVSCGLEKTYGQKGSWKYRDHLAQATPAFSVVRDLLTAQSILRSGERAQHPLMLACRGCCSTVLLMKL